MGNNNIWTKLLRLFAALLCISVAIFLSVPRDSVIKKASATTSAFLSVICIILAKLARKFEAENEIQLVNQDIRRHPIDAAHPDEHIDFNHDVDAH